MNDDTRQARISAAMTALFQGERGDVALGYYTVRSRMDAALDAADAIGRERVTFTPEQTDLMKWCVEQGKEVFFYGDGFDDDFLEQLEALEALLTPQPEPGGSDAGQPATPEGGAG